MGGQELPRIHLRLTRPQADALAVCLDLFQFPDYDERSGTEQLQLGEIITQVEERLAAEIKRDESWLTRRTEKERDQLTEEAALVRSYIERKGVNKVGAPKKAKPEPKSRPANASGEALLSLLGPALANIAASKGAEADA